MTRHAYVTESGLVTGTDLLTGVSSPYGVYLSDLLTRLEVARPNGTLLQAVFPEFSPQTQEDAWILDQYVGESDIRRAAPA